MGKTTLLEAIMGLLAVGEGAIRAFGGTLTGLPPHAIARTAIAYAPQEQTLFQDLTVEENLRLGGGDRRGFSAALDRIGRHFPFLPRRLPQRAGTLSGGE